MKRQYMKPAIRVVEMQHRQIICTSPGGPDSYNSKTLNTNRGASDDKVTEIEDIF